MLEIPATALKPSLTLFNSSSDVGILMYVDESEATACENDFEMRDMDGCDILMQSLLICCSDPDAYNLIAANT